MIQDQDHFSTIFSKISDGHPGVVAVLLELYKDTAKIDPEIPWGGFGSIIRLDRMGIYGSQLWALYKHVCNQDTQCLIALLRAWHLGLIQEPEIKYAILKKQRLDIAAL